MQQRPAWMMSDRERILWLLDFLRQDLAAIRPGALWDLRDGAIRVLQNAHVRVAWPREGRLQAAIARDLTAVQSRLRAGIVELHQGHHWYPFHRQSPPAPEWVVRTTDDGGVLFRTHSSPEMVSVLIASAVDLLMRWWPQLRRCRHCEALFLPRHGRQWYHDTRCSGSARYVKFKAKAAKKKRDYIAEEQRRAAREYARKKKARK
ncbi:MAG: hypothetical protein HYY76_00930 [Acidobacteria bacterium]|nr:hypothetical protein [Acidobacteriota bacterium]